MGRKAALWILAAYSFYAVAAPPQPLAVVGATVIDATGAPPRPDQAVVLVNGRIQAVGPPAQVALPRGTRVIDAHGMFLIPGLWDMHVHVLRGDRPDAYFPLLIAYGVTGVRDMGGNYDFADLRRMQAEIAAGQRIGPQFVAAGPLIDGPYPYLPSISRVVTNAAQARAVVDELKRDGANFIKVFNGLSRESYFALAGEAKRIGIPFAGHVPFSISAREASQAGQKSIEHLFNVAFACSSREHELMRTKAKARAPGLAGERRRLRREYLHGVLDSFSPRRCAALYQTFIKNHTWQVPTLVERRAYSRVDAPDLNQAERAYILRSQRGAWLAQRDQRLHGGNADDHAIQRRYWQLDHSLVAPMHAAGVRFLAGTDAGDPYSVPGISLHDELTELAECGFTPMQALQTATRNAAQFLNRNDFGTIEAGKRADLVLLKANPLTDIHNTQQIEAVVLGGRWLDRARLDALLTQARVAAQAN